MFLYRPDNISDDCWCLTAPLPLLSQPSNSHLPCPHLIGRYMNHSKASNLSARARACVKLSNGCFEIEDNTVIINYSVTSIKMNWDMQFIKDI